MRSRSALLRPRHLPRSVDARHALTFSSTSTGRFPRSVGYSSRVSENLRTQQLSSSASTPPEDDTPAIEPVVEGKPKRRAPRSSSKAVDKESSETSATTSSGIQRANVEDILWQPQDSAPGAGVSPGDDPHDHSLPEPWLLQDAYETLLLALHPQTQHRATYSSSTGVAIEPTLGFYCPIEGGDYVLDATIRNLAKRANADVVVIDALELSAGEHGRYGKAASVLQFSDNPLHAPSTNPPPSSRARRQSPREDDAEDDDPSAPFLMGAPAAFTIQIPTGGSGSMLRSSRGGPTSALSTMSRGSPISAQRVKAFFDDLLNLPSSSSSSSSSDKDAESMRRPRIVYVRNYPHIADHVPTWFPGLQAAVRARRQGPMARPTSPVTGPTVIILGSSPPIQEDPPSRSPSRPSSSIMGLLQAAGRIPPPPKPPTNELSWSETDRKSRERRLKERLRKWQKGHEGLAEEIPPFVPPSNPSGASSSGRRMGMMPELSLGSNVIAIPFGQSSSEGPGSLSSSIVSEGYFRVVGLVPRTRDENMERKGRMAYRLKFNSLALKLAVSEAGGDLGGRPVVSIDSVAKTLETTPTESSDQDPVEANLVASAKEHHSTQSLPFLESCLINIKSWRELRVVADAVVGAALSASASERGLQALDSSIDPTPVTWEQVTRSVESTAESNSLRTAWIDGINSPKDTEGASVSGEPSEESVPVPEVDEVLEAVRKDPDLDQHEQRLLGCIVDPATMPTAFKSVHLPPSTIDAVRTMVSLPLLFPHAFSTGILKTHAMEGALLFGPPGTGKTLLARAIARESGARMMIIKPSDVMDMYVGEGEKLVRSVFTLARRLSPSVVFIDEIDALFGARVSNRESGGTMAHRGIITEFMQEMDGLKSSRDQTVVVIGATNRPFDLDDAVLRRLPRRILVDLPGPAEREEILKILLRDEKLADDVDLKALGLRTESFSGSDLKHLCIAAALDSVKESVDVPWAVPSKSTTPPTSTDTTSSPLPATSTSSATPEPVTKPIAATTVPITSIFDTDPDSSTPPITHPIRILATRHFTKALQEITPSASESLGTLSSLRKWNDEFGEGASGKAKKRRGWGDKFGFGTLPAVDLVQTSTNASPPAST